MNLPWRCHCCGNFINEPSAVDEVVCSRCFCTTRRPAYKPLSMETLSRLAEDRIALGLPPSPYDVVARCDGEPFGDIASRWREMEEVPECDPSKI